jgi:hypothetical protein
MVTCKKSGGISMENLVQFLKHMDKLNVFPRLGGLKPILLLDGHGSRLELPFSSSMSIILAIHGWFALVSHMVPPIGK